MAVGIYFLVFIVAHQTNNEITLEMCLCCTNRTNVTWKIKIKAEYKGIEMPPICAASPVVFLHERNRADSQLGNSTIVGLIPNN